MSTDTEHGPCPICETPVRFNPRYPRAVCETCADLSTDEDGRLLHLYNRSISGGLIATFADGSLPDLRMLSLDRPLVFIGGRQCSAEEHRFGGIVVQVL